MYESIGPPTFVHVRHMHVQTGICSCQQVYSILNSLRICGACQYTTMSIYLLRPVLCAAVGLCDVPASLSLSPERVVKSCVSGSGSIHSVYRCTANSLVLLVLTHPFLRNSYRTVRTRSYEIPTVLCVGFLRSRHSTDWAKCSTCSCIREKKKVLNEV